MNSGRDAVAAARAAAATGLPFAVSFVAWEGATRLSGEPLRTAAARAIDAGAAVVGVNCLPIANVAACRRALADLGAPLLVSPNLGQPEPRTGFAQDASADPRRFPDAFGGGLTAAAGILGGCCATTPTQIAALVERVRQQGPPPGNPVGYGRHGSRTRPERPKATDDRSRADDPGDPNAARMRPRARQIGSPAARACPPASLPLPRVCTPAALSSSRAAPGSRPSSSGGFPLDLARGLLHPDALIMGRLRGAGPHSRARAGYPSLRTPRARSQHGRFFFLSRPDRPGPPRRAASFGRP